MIGDIWSTLGRNELALGILLLVAGITVYILVVTSIKVTRDTKFDHLSGFSELHSGRHVEAKVVMVRGRLVASRIDRPSN